jgi:hypothetical protein
MSLITSRLATALDAGVASLVRVVWSEDGATISSNVAPTTMTLSSATTANPSVVANSGALESAEASGPCTITHFAFAQSDGTTLGTTWNELDSPAVLLGGGKITVAIGALKEELHQATEAPT